MSRTRGGRSYNDNNDESSEEKLTSENKKLNSEIQRLKEIISSQKSALKASLKSRNTEKERHQEAQNELKATITQLNHINCQYTTQQHLLQEEITNLHKKIADLETALRHTIEKTNSREHTPIKNETAIGLNASTSSAMTDATSTAKGSQSTSSSSLFSYLIPRNIWNKPETKPNISESSENARTQASVQQALQATERKISRG